jgi:hypothetical protein
VILYSIIPAEVVFNNSDIEKTVSKEIEYLGEKVIVTPFENNQLKIQRLISTSPKAYLNPRLQPGAILSP